MEPTTEQMLWLHRRSEELKSELKGRVPDHQLDEAAKQQALLELETLDQGQGTIQSQLRYQSNLRTFSEDDKPTFKPALTSAGVFSPGDLTPMMAANDFRLGWRSPMEWASGLFGDRQGGRGDLSAMHVPRRSDWAGGGGGTGDWSTGNRTGDAALNFLWNFYDTFTVFGGPLQKFIESKTGLDVYPDWTEDVQDKYIRTAGGIGQAAGLILPMIASGGAHTAIAGPAAAAKGMQAIGRWGTIGKVLRMSPMMKLFGVGHKVGAKAISTGLQKATGAVSQVALKKKIAFKVSQKVFKMGRGKITVEHAEKLGHMMAGTIVGVKETATMQRLASKGVKHTEAIGAARNIVGNRMEGYFKYLKKAGLNLTAGQKSEFGRIVNDAFSTKTMDKAMDLVTSKFGKSMLSIVDHGIASGMAMAVHGGAKAAAEMTAEGIPAHSQIPILGQTVLSAMGTGLMFGAIGMLPNLGKGSGGDAWSKVLRGLGLSTRGTQRFINSAQGFQKNLSRVVGNQPVDVAMSKMSILTGTPVEAMKGNPFNIPSNQILLKSARGRAKLQSIAANIRKAIRGDKELWNRFGKKFKYIMTGSWKENQLPGVVRELEEWQRYHRGVLIREGIRESSKDFLGALPRMMTGAFLLHAPEILRDRDMIEEHPEDFIQGLLMSMYFTRNYSNPFAMAKKAKGYEERGFYNTELNESMKALHIGGMFFPELFTQTDMSQAIARLMNGLTSPKDLSHDQASKDIVAAIEEVTGAPILLGKETIEFEIVDTAAERQVREGKGVKNAKRQRRLKQLRSLIVKMQDKERTTPLSAKDSKTLKRARKRVNSLEKRLKNDKVYEALGEKMGPKMKERDKTHLEKTKVRVKEIEERQKGRDLKDIEQEKLKRWEDEYEVLSNMESEAIAETKLGKASYDLEGETLARHKLDANGNRLTLARMVDAVNGMLGARALEGERVLMDDTWSESTKWRVFERLQKYFGVSDIGPHLITQIVEDSVTEVDVIEMRGTIEELVRRVHDGLILENLVKGYSSIEIIGEAADELDEETRQKVLIYNNFLEHFMVSGGPKYMRDTVHTVTEEESAQAAADGHSRIPRPGTPKPAAYQVKSKAEFIAFKEKFEKIWDGYTAKDGGWISGAYEVAAKRWAKFSGGDPDSLRNPRVVDFLASKYGYGHKIWMANWHSGELETVPVYTDELEPNEVLRLSGGIIKDASFQDMAGLLYVAGVIPGSGTKRKVIRLLPDFSEFPEKYRNFIPGEDLDTKEYNYNIMKKYLEVLPHLAPTFEAGSKDIFTKTEWNSREAGGLQDAMKLLMATGMGVGPESLGAARDHAIKKRYRSATTEQINLLVSAIELGLFNFKTGIFKLPDNIVMKKGKVLNFDPANMDSDILAVLSNRGLYETEDGITLIETLREMKRKGIIHAIEGEPGEHVTTLGVYGMKAGMKLNGVEAFRYLTSVFRANKALLKESPDTLVNRFINSINTQELRDRAPKIIDVLTEEAAKIAKGNPSQFFKFIRILETQGIIAGVNPDGTWNQVNIDKLLSPHMQKILKNYTLGATMRNFETFTTADAEETMAWLSSNVGKVIESHSVQKLPMSRFVNESGIPDDLFTELVVLVQEEVVPGSKVKLAINNWQGLKDYIFSRSMQMGVGPGGQPVLSSAMSPEHASFLSKMTPSEWRAVFHDIYTTREIESISFSQNTELIKGGNLDIETNNAPRIIKSKERIHGQRLVDRFADDGLGYVAVGDSVSTGNIKSERNKPAYGESVDINGGAGVDGVPVGHELLVNLFKTSNRRPVDIVEAGRSGARKAGQLNTVYVPIGPSGAQRNFMLSLPLLGKTGSTYEQFYNAMKMLNEQFGRVKNKTAVDDPSLRGAWGDSQLVRMADSIFDVFKALPDPAKMKDFEVGESLGKYTRKLSDSLLRAMQAYTITKTFGNEWLDMLYNTERGKLLLDKQAEGSAVELAKALAKYSHQMTNVSAPGLVKEQWAEFRDKANAQDLPGPMLEGDDLRIVVVNDDVLQKFGEGKNEYYNGMVIMSSRVAYGLSLGSGLNNAHPLIKANIVTGNAVGPDGKRFSLLTKDSFQVVDSYQKILEIYGADIIVPNSAIKWPSSVLGGKIYDNMLTLDNIDIGKVDFKSGSSIFRVPISDVRTTMFAEMKSKEGNVSAFIEQGLDGPAMKEFREQFGPTSDYDPGYKAYTSMAKVLKMAGKGNVEAIRYANSMLRSFYLMSESVGEYEDPTYDAIHKDYIFSSRVANPMDEEYKKRSINFIVSRVFKDQIFKRPDSHARSVKMQVSYRDKDPNWVMATPNTHAVRSRTQQGAWSKNKIGGMGTAMGASYDVDVELHDNTQFAIFDEKNDTWVRSRRDNAGLGFSDMVRVILDTRGSKAYSMAFKKFLAQNNIDPSSNKSRNINAISKLMDKFISSTSYEHLDIEFSTKSGTEGRFFEMIDWMFAGSQATDTGHGYDVQKTRASFDYGRSINRRNGLKLGIVSVWQRSPGFKGNDTIVAVKEGLLPENSGNVGMLNRYDFETRAEGDWDYDAMTYMNHLGPKTIDHLLKRSLHNAKIDIDNHENASTFDSKMDYGDFKSWMKLKNSRFISDKFIGYAQRFNQSYSHLVKGQTYQRFVDAQTGEIYHVGPRFRDYNEMKNAKANLLIPHYVQIFTDSAGKMLSDASRHTGMEAGREKKGGWQTGLYDRLFAVYKDKGGTPDFGSEIQRTSSNKIKINTIIDTMLAPYNELSHALIADKKKGLKNYDDIIAATRSYAARQWGVDRHKQGSINAINDFVLTRLMRRHPDALEDFLLSATDDVPRMKKLLAQYHGKEKRPKGQSKKYTWGMIMNNVKMGRSVQTSYNTEYMSVREKIAERINEESGILDPDKHTGLNAGELGSLAVLNNFVQQVGGLPNSKVVSKLGSVLYDYYENKAVYTYKEAKQQRAELEAELKGYAERNMNSRDAAVRGARAALDGVNRFLQRSYRLKNQAHDMDEKQKFFLNESKPGKPGWVKTMTDDDVITRMIGHLSYTKLKSKLSRGANPEDVETIIFEADQINKIIRGMWANSYKTGRGDLKYSLFKEAERGAALTTEIINRATSQLMEEFIHKYSSKGLDQLAAVAIVSSRANDIQGWWRLNRQTANKKVNIPVYRNVRQGGLKYLSKESLQYIAQSRAAVRSAIHGKQPEIAMSMFHGDNLNMAALLGKGGTPWHRIDGDPTKTRIEDVINRQSVTGANGIPHEVKRTPGPPLTGFDATTQVPVQLGMVDFELMSAGRLQEILQTVGGFTYTTASQIVTIATNRKNRGLDLTRVDPTHPFANVVSFLVKERKFEMPRYDVQDEKLLSKWVRNKEQRIKDDPLMEAQRFATRKNNMRNGGSGDQGPPDLGPSGGGGGPVVPPSPTLLPGQGGVGGTPTQGGGGGLTPTEPVKGGFTRPSVLPQANMAINEQERVTAQLGRVTKKFGDPLIQEYFGGTWDSLRWAVRVLGKDVNSQVLTMDDVITLDASVERLKLGILRMERMNRGVMGKIKSWFFPPTAALGDDPRGLEFAHKIEHLEFTRGSREKVLARDIDEITADFDEVYKLNHLNKKASRYASEKGSLEEQQKILIKKIQLKERSHKLRGIDPDKDSKYKELRNKEEVITQKLLQYDVTDGGDINKINTAVIELVSSIQKVKDGNIIWRERDKHLVDEILGNEKDGIRGNYSATSKQMEKLAVKMHTFFERIYPLIEEGFESYKELMGNRFKKSYVNDYANKILESIKLGKKEGYFPHWDSNFLYDLAWTSDFVGGTGMKDAIQHLAPNIFEPTAKGTGEIIKRKGGPEWSKNALMVMTRYANNAIMFAYKNNMELEFSRMFKSLHQQLNSSLFNGKRFNEQVNFMDSYVRDLRENTIGYDENADTFIRSASKYIRGLQLISKLGFRLSTPVRNITQIAAGMAATGIRKTLDALKWAKTEKGVKFLGEVVPTGGVGDIEFMTTSQKVKSVYTGENPFGTKVSKVFNAIVSRMLWPLQKMPGVGEHDARSMLRVVVMKETHDGMMGNPYWEHLFKTRNFTPEMLRAYPELKKFAQLNVDGSPVDMPGWDKVWHTQLRHFVRHVGNELSTEVVGQIHFGYSETSRAKLMRASSPIGAMMLQLKHFSFKNAEMWIKFIDDARMRRLAGKADGINEGWGKFFKSREGRAMMELGTFSALMQMSKAVIPFGIAWMFRPDWAEMLTHGQAATLALRRGDQKAFDKTFYGKGPAQMLAGPAFSDATLFMNLMFANHIGDPSNLHKMLMGFRDYRKIDNAELLHKYGRMLGPTAFADLMYYDVPEAIKSKGRSLPSSMASQLGFRYRSDEGSLSEYLGDKLQEGYQNFQTKPMIPYLGNAPMNTNDFKFAMQNNHAMLFKPQQNRK